MPEPYCLAMVLCDATYTEPTTKKHTLLGTFTNINAEGFPAKVRLSIYLAVTDGIGPTTLRIQIVDAAVGAIVATDESEQPGRILLIKTEVSIPNPLAVVESCLAFGFVIPHEGLYHCELWANEAPLMTRRFTATIQTKPKA
ncbi:MAG: hypothetical protein HYS13_23340 [Planctomycetia bacterium]|nr:hypothetical protein [Planctomycetia bacterium]